VDRRLAGIAVGFSFTPARFRVDLPAVGDYEIRLALGDAASGQTIHLVTKDNTTTLDNYDGATGGVANFFDATGVARSAANWPSANLPVTRTFASTIFRIQESAASASSVIAHVSLNQVSSRRFILGRH